MICGLVTNAQPYTVFILISNYIILAKNKIIFGGVKRGRTK